MHCRRGVNEQWATTVDLPFVISSCTEGMVISDLRFRMEELDGDPVLLSDEKAWSKPSHHEDEGTTMVELHRFRGGR